MTISRMQQPRQLYMGGGINQLPINEMMIPRSQYGLGSLVKSVTKGVKGLVGGVKDFVKSDLGKAALLAAGGYYLGGGSLLGMQRVTPLSKFAFGQIPGVSAVSNIFTAGDKTKKATSFGNTMKVFAGGSLLGGLLGQAEETGDPENITRNVDALRIKLADAYKNQRTFSDEADEDAAIAQQVEKDVSEYTQDTARTGIMAANGGRIGYQNAGMVNDNKGIMQMASAPDPMDEFDQMKENIAEKLFGKSLKNLSKMELIKLEELMDQMDMPTFARGGRIGYALGSPENNAIRASKMMNLPLNKNKAGITELDLRKTGGFIPPVGIKEKADDIPAMLSNNEFVMTADAVRNAGDGDVNKGAQRMYDMMKKLENRKIT